MSNETNNLPLVLASIEHAGYVVLQGDRVVARAIRWKNGYHVTSTGPAYVPTGSSFSIQRSESCGSKTAILSTARRLLAAEAQA